MNVAFFVHSAGLGGAERSLLELVAELVADYGASCTVVVPGQGPLNAALLLAGAALIVNDDVGQWCQPSGSTEDIPARLTAGSHALCDHVIPALRRFKPDLIFTQTLTIPWGAAAASLLGKPHIWSVCEFGELDHHLQFPVALESICDAIVKGSSFVLTVSNAVRARLFPHLAEKMHTVYRHIPIPPDNIEHAVAPFPSCDRIRMTLAGTIVEGKGQEDAVRALAELVERGQDVELLLVGQQGPAYTARIKALVKNLNLKDRVHIEEFSSDPYTIIRRSDILLVCSRHEAFGRIALEGMLLAKPVIYSRSGGVLEYMEDGITGLAYTPGDGVDLADRVMEFVADPDRTHRIAAEAKRRAEARFTRDAYGGEIYRIMQRVLRTKNAPIQIPPPVAATIAAAMRRHTLVQKIALRLRAIRWSRPWQVRF